MEKNMYALHLITLEFTGKFPQILMKLIEIVGKSIQHNVSFICETHIICTVLHTDFGLIVSPQNP
jgi:hypothetical protein